MLKANISIRCKCGKEFNDKEEYEKHVRECK
jgi:hypothetical protein